MQYAVRNTLILAVLLIVVIVGFVITNTRIVKQKEELEIVLNKIDLELTNLKAANPDYLDIERITNEYEAMRIRDQVQGKIVPDINNPTMAYNYLLDICDRFAPNIDFEFSLTSSGAIGSTQYNSYLINGLAEINSLYTFLYHLENNIQFYTIESIALNEELSDDEISAGKTASNMVRFKINLNAYYDPKIAQTIENQGIRNLRYSGLAYNPFYTRVYEPTRDAVEEEYVNVDFARVIGLTPEAVFLRDTNEQVILLTPGDKVAYGFLDSINWEDQSVLFKINRIGITKEKILYLNKD